MNCYGPMSAKVIQLRREPVAPPSMSDAEQRWRDACYRVLWHIYHGGKKREVNRAAKAMFEARDEFLTLQAAAK